MQDTQTLWDTISNYNKGQCDIYKANPGLSVPTSAELPYLAAIEAIDLDQKAWMAERKNNES